MLTREHALVIAQQLATSATTSETACTTTAKWSAALVAWALGIKLANVVAADEASKNCHWTGPGCQAFTQIEIAFPTPQPLQDVGRCKIWWSPAPELPHGLLVIDVKRVQEVFAIAQSWATAQHDSTSVIKLWEMHIQCESLSLMARVEQRRRALSARENTMQERRAVPQESLGCSSTARKISETSTPEVLKYGHNDVLRQLTQRH